MGGFFDVLRRVLGWWSSPSTPTQLDPGGTFTAEDPGPTFTALDPGPTFTAQDPGATFTRVGT